MRIAPHPRHSSPRHAFAAAATGCDRTIGCDIATAERAGAFENASRASGQIEFTDASNATYCEEFGHGLQPKS
jgi:hypothetical protein